MVKIMTTHIHLHATNGKTKDLGGRNDRARELADSAKTKLVRLKAVLDDAVRQDDQMTMPTIKGILSDLGKWV